MKMPFGDMKEENLPREPWIQEGITTFKEIQMTKQEEIGKKVAGYLLGLRHDKILDELPLGGQALYYKWADDLLKYLHSQGIRLPDGNSLIKEE